MNILFIANLLLLICTICIPSRQSINNTSENDPMNHIYKINNKHNKSANTMNHNDEYLDNKLKDVTVHPNTFENYKTTPLLLLFKNFTADCDKNQTTKIRKHSHNLYNGLLDVILNGSIEKLRSVPKRKVVRWMGALDEIPNVSLQQKLTLWEIFKDGQSVKKFNRNDLELMGNLILIIPENDLYNLNVLDKDVIDYLGTLKTMTRRKAAILAYAIDNKFNTTDILNSTLLNDMKGLLCGYPKYKFEKMNEELVHKLNSSVFQNLWPCTEEQLEILLDLFGTKVKIWDNTTIEHIGLLATVLKPLHIKNMETDVISGFNENILWKMDYKNILAFSKLQIRHFNNGAKEVYKTRKFIVTSNGNILSFKVICFFVAFISYTVL